MWTLNIGGPGMIKKCFFEDAVKIQGFGDVVTVQQNIENKC